MPPRSTPARCKGKRIGVMRFASGFGTDAAFEAALAVLKAQGATLVEIKEFDDEAIGDNEFAVLLTEFKAGLNDYLATSPAPMPVRTLADVIAFNKANAAPKWRCSGRTLFEKAEATKGLDRPGLSARRARPASRRPGRTASTGCSRAQARRAGRADHAAGVEDRRGQWRPDLGRRRGQPRGGRRLSAPHRADGPGEGPAGRA